MLLLQGASQILSMDSKKCLDLFNLKFRENLYRLFLRQELEQLIGVLKDDKRQVRQQIKQWFFSLVTVRTRNFQRVRLVNWFS